MKNKKILVVFGTRPEAIKMAPIIIELKKHNIIDLRICVTAQHREMLDQVLNLFQIQPNIDLNLMKPNQTLADITSSVLIKMDEVLKKENPDIVLIQGDTTTVMATAIAAFYNNIHIGHVEAGLRSFNIKSPFPEEFNRKVVSSVTKYHFAPTERSKTILLREGIKKENIFLTGNTVIDSLFYILKKPIPEYVTELTKNIPKNSKIILITAHRRENFGEKFLSICRGIKKIVERNKDVYVIFPVHYNPNVREPVFKILNNIDRILLIDPVEYNILVHLMNISYLILTDSGGIQEEAPSLGKPVLVLRTETERPEGIEVGVAKLVGPYEEKIVEETEKLIYDIDEYNKMAQATNPYGDGNSSKRIVEILLNN